MGPSVLDTSTAHADLVRGQLLAISNRISRPYEGHAERMTRRAEDGVQTLQDVLSAAGVTRRDLDRCQALADADARFEFLNWLPHAATVGGAAGDATEKAIFGSCSGEPRAIASLIQLFALVLDGLIDEAPDILAPERGMLFDFMFRGWDPDYKAPTRQQINNKHAVVSLLYKIALEWIRLVRRTQGWCSEASVREELAAAVKAALQSEYTNTPSIYDVATGRASIESCRKVIMAKSANAVWVSALAPICARGWPDNLDHHLYRRCAYLMGAYIGWIDDIEDLLEDLSAGRWSLVSVDLYVYAGQPRSLAPAELMDRLAETLGIEGVRQRLIKTGLDRYDELVRGLDAIDIDKEPILQLVEDATLAGLREDELTGGVVFPA